MSVPLKYTQNFLTSPRLVRRLVAMASPTAEIPILEIGPGQGIITHALAQHIGPHGRLLALELDPQLIPILRQKFAPHPQVEIRHQDILHYDLAQLPQPYHVFANIPFSITAPLLHHLFTPPHAPQTAHLILQTAALTEKNRAGFTVDTFKALLIKPLYDITPAHRFAKTDFTPAPSVHTTLFRFQHRPQPLIPLTHYPLYQNFLAFIAKDRVGEGAWRQLFSQKQLKLMASRTPLVLNRGLKTQSIQAITSAFDSFLHHAQPKHGRVQNALANLRRQQDHRNQQALRGHHHRSRRKKR